jgi:flagellar basal body-associated protein FliL
MMKKKILIISIIAGLLLLTAGGITGFFLMRADAQKEREPGSMSPEIFLHVNDHITTDVMLYIEDGITLTIPEVQNGKHTVWEDVSVQPDGTITYHDVDYE